MTIALNIAGGGSLYVAELKLVRALGEPTRWCFGVNIGRDVHGDEEPWNLAKLLQGPALQVYPFLSDEQGTAVLGADAIVTGAQWREASNIVDIDADSTRLKSPPSVFVPRRRIHNVRNMLDLLSKFRAVAEPLEGLKASLQDLAFPDGTNSCIVQDGLSDWQFLLGAIEHCRFLAPKAPNWLPLTLVGGVDENNGTAGRWVLTPGSRRAYEEWGLVASRRERLQSGADKDGALRIEFGSAKSTIRTSAFADAAIPTVRYCWEGRQFSAVRWNDWRVKEMPRFDEIDAMIYRIDDRLYRSHHDNILWDTILYATSSDAAFGVPELPVGLQPWMEIGKVNTSSKDGKGPWMSVLLKDFEKGEDLVQVRLTTPFSGASGNKGLHFEPEAGTSVAVGWSGRFDHSVLLGGNVRDGETEFRSPSIFLEKQYTAQYVDVDVKSVGQVTVHSDLGVAVSQRTKITSSDEMNIHADEADIKLSGGIVYTGR